MANLNKETLRAACQDNPGQSMMICTDDVLELLDDLSRATDSCARHGDALQRIGQALSLDAGADLHRECVPKIHGLFLSIGSGVTEAYRERIACQRVIESLRAEVETLKASLKACHPFRPVQEIKP